MADWTTAKEAGQPFFEVQLEVGSHVGSAGFGRTEGRRTISSSAVTLGEIEKLGWRLENASYYFMITGETSTRRVFVTGSHPADTARFSRAMGYATSRLLAAMTAAGYRPPPARRIVDVGGSRGTMLAWFLAAVPEATGVLFDRPESLAAAPGFLASAGVADRTELVPGNFFAEVPEGDLHVISQVLHNWDDDNVRRIVANCARAAHPDGSLVVIEYVLPPKPDPVIGQVMDVLMMVLVGGRERTLEEHRGLIEPAGYTFTREIPVGAPAGQQPPWRLLEFRRS